MHKVPFEVVISDSKPLTGNRGLQFLHRIFPNRDIYKTEVEFSEKKVAGMTIYSAAYAGVLED